MSDRPNGENRSLVARVATELVALSEELRELNEQTEVQIGQIRALARVIMRPNVVFMEETVEKVATVVQQSGDIDHRRGSIKYQRADKIRKLAKK